MKIKNLLLIVIGIFILSSCGQKMNNKVTLKNEKDSISYVIGVDIANSLKNAGVEEINYNNFVAGLNDAMEESELKIEEAKIRPYMQQYFAKLQEKKKQEMEVKKQTNLDEGHQFLEKNKEKEGIIVTESGLQYEIIEEGTGKSPEATSLVVCNYRGTLLDGTEFDTSYGKEKPAEFQLNRVIPGWTEGIQLMKEGAKYKFYIPTEIAYGERVRPGGKIEPNMAIIFEVELIEVKEAPVPEKKN
jgi:FKBP-type peptidyl-prolyl cis-trans isomerase